MAETIDELDRQLLVLGRQELSLENDLTELRRYGRGAAERGDQDIADANWAMYELARNQLLQVLAAISQLEARIYILRRRR